jgi:hypothetical protein
MKRSQKITRVRLEINHDKEVILLGLVSSEPDYRLSLMLNNTLDISLRHAPPVKVEGDTSSSFSFSRFSAVVKSPDQVMDLISNKSGNQILIKKLRNIDFILQIYGIEEEYDTPKLIKILREIENITAVFEIDIKDLNDKSLKFPI